MHIKTSIKVVKLYDNFHELYENVEYKYFGEETVYEKIGFLDIEKIDTLNFTLDKIMEDNGCHRRTIFMELKKDTLIIECQFINIPLTKDKELDIVVDNVSEEIDLYLKSILKKEDEVENLYKRINIDFSDADLLQIDSLGTGLSISDVLKVTNYLDDNEIDYEIYEMKSSVTEAGASGGGGEVILAIIGLFADLSTIVSAIRESTGISSVIVNSINKNLLEKGKNILSEEYNLNMDKIKFFKMEIIESDGDKVYVYTDDKDKEYRVVFDKNNIVTYIGN